LFPRPDSGGHAQQDAPRRRLHTAAVAEGVAAAHFRVIVRGWPRKAGGWLPSVDGFLRPPRRRQHCRHQALSRRRVHGVHTRVLANQNAQLQSHANHAGHTRPSRTDRMLRHTKELRTRMCHFVPYVPNTFTCARFFLISRARERVRKSLEPPVAIVSALLIGRHAAFPKVNFCPRERDLICSFRQPIFEHVAFMNVVFP